MDDEDDLRKDISSPLPNDGDTPFSEPDEQPSDEVSDFFDVELREEERKLEDTHPVTDTNIDKTEWYQEGLEGAAEAEQPNSKDKVTDYDSEDDQRKKPE